MGLISATLGSASSVLREQWKEYFYCDALPVDTLVVKGRKKTSGFSFNASNDNIISNGSMIAVADGQCMLIVEQGKVVDLCAEPGEYKYDMSTEPSLLDGGRLGDNIKAVFANIGKRFTFGGVAPKDQRVYYFNTREIVGNKYGTPSPIPFRVVDQRAGIDIDIAVRCFGEYSYKVTNPLLFYTNVCGNVSQVYRREELESQLRSELLTALQPAFARVSEQGIRYSALPGHTTELSLALKTELTQQWKDFRGIEIQKVGVSSVKASEQDEAMLKELQRNAAFANPTLAAAHLVGAQADAMKAAASNAAGAAVGFMGMNMASAAGGLNAQTLFQMGQQQPTSQPAPTAPTASATDGWVCPSCGTTAKGKFCPECGTAKPLPKISAGWVCPSCGTSNTGRFCAECGTKKPSTQKYRCDKCGWTPADPTKPPKFCPECGDPFNDGDVVG